MSELIKYLSPAAILGIIWGIVLFYQKRKDEKFEKRRDEKLVIYSSLHSALGSLNFNIIKFLSNSTPPLLLLMEEEQSINISLKNLGKRSDVLKEKFDAVKEESNIGVNEINKLESELKKNNESLKEILFKQGQVQVENKINFSTLFEQLTTTLKLKIEEINNIPILVIPKKINLKASIFSLTNQINLVLEKYYSKQHIDEKGLINIDFIDLLEEVSNIINNLQSKITEDIK